MKGYPLDRLNEEIAFVCYHFNWSHATLMRMEHRDRQMWCEEISKINQQRNEPEERERSLDQMF